MSDNPGSLFGVLTRDEIVAAKILKDYDPNNLKPTSYDLRFGKEVILCGQDSTGIMELPYKNDKGKVIPWVEIAPLESMIFSTRESVSMPDNVIGRFDLKIGFGLDGLILQVGPQVEPGYAGLLFGFLINTRSEPKQLLIDQAFMTIEFSYTTRSVNIEDETKKGPVISMEAFLKRQKLLIADIAKPNGFQMIREELRRCRSDHQRRDDEKEKTDDWILRTKDFIWKRRQVIIGIIAAILAAATIGLTAWLNWDKIRDAFQRPHKGVGETATRDRMALPDGQWPAPSNNAEANRPSKPHE